MDYEEIRRAAELRGYAPAGLMRLAAVLGGTAETRKKRKKSRYRGAAPSKGVDKRRQCVAGAKRTGGKGYERCL